MVRQVLKAFSVVLGVSLVCSFLVTSTIVLLEQRRAHNKLAHKIESLLALAEIPVGAEADPVQIYRSHIRPMLVDLESGRVAKPGAFRMDDLIVYDIERMARHPEHAVIIPRDLDLADIKRRPRYLPVYLRMADPGFTHLILPIYGRGLWSTLYGYLALKSDLVTIAGIGFYEHKETPGLGGEVDSPRWKASWPGKQAFDEQGRLAIRVMQGSVDPRQPEAIHHVDGISGATFTTRGVDHLVRYWLGPHGYGPFLHWLRAQNHARF